MLEKTVKNYLKNVTVQKYLKKVVKQYLKKPLKIFEKAV